MPKTKSPRHRKILQALVALGGVGTTREIADQCGLDTNGVSQSLGSISMEDQVESAGGDSRGGGIRWRLIPKKATLPF